MNDARRRDLLSRALLGGLVAAGASLRLSLLFHDDGIYWPDEIYQSLEPAHRLVFGYGLVPWEFIQGARAWAFPSLVAGLMALLRAARVDSPESYLHWIRGSFAVLGALTAAGVYRLARAHSADRPSALAGAAAWSLGAVFIYFAPRAMGENLSALLVAFGLALALPRHARAIEVGAGALLLGLATWVRLQNALFAVVMLGAWAVRRRREPLQISAVVLAAAAVGLGLLDRLTWGSWFHSAIEYVKFNLIEGKGAQWGVAGPGYYLWTLAHSMPALSLVLALLAGWGAGRRWALAAAFGVFLAVHMGIGHKELRFLLPGMPVLCALAAVGASSLERPELRWGAILALFVSASASAITAGNLTFGDLGQYADVKPHASAYDDFGPVNRLLEKAHELPDLCGLKVEGVHLAWTGGYSYLHRPVALYGNNGPGRERGYYNYVITPLPWARGLPLVARDANFALARLDVPRCGPDPHFTWRLP